ncbi:hydroxyacid dehydrogenase, partial [Candidatus Micrarchaeota archaeon]|nr:hydroxyacid dehydrogenase [Candidatus Micrarchaeota archaeon]
LKYIVTQSTGYDHIDIETCRTKGVRVYNIPDYGTESVAEFTVLLMLALLRKFKMCENSLREHIDIGSTDLKGNEAGGKILGVIGTGRVGSHVIKIAHVLGMRIIAYNRSEIRELVAKYGVKFVRLSDLFKQSDVIILQLPLTEESYHIIDKKAISKMKKGVYIVNTARGGLVDTVALAEAIETHVAGAALDVVEAEDLIAHESDVLKEKVNAEKIRRAFIGNMLLQRDNVIITPHVAYNTEEALRRITEKTITTIKELDNGKTDLYNLVV